MFMFDLTSPNHIGSERAKNKIKILKKELFSLKI